MIPARPVRREAGPSTTSLPGPWSEAPNVPPGSPGCARPMSDALPPNTVIFAVGTVFVQSKARPWIVESDHFHVIPGNPLSPSYRESIPKFNTPCLDAISTLCGRRIILSDNSKIFFTSITQFVPNGIKISHWCRGTGQTEYKWRGHYKITHTWCRGTGQTAVPSAPSTQYIPPLLL